MSIPTEEEHVNGHGGGVCQGCKKAVVFAEVALGDVHFGVCRKCAEFIAGVLRADDKVACRQRGDYAGDFTEIEKATEATA